MIYYFGMSVSTPKPAKLAPTTNLDAARSTAQRQFVTIALNMMWQLAIVVLLPVIIGVQLDKAIDSGHTLTYIGLALGFAGATLVMWRSMKLANSLPVPKLTAAQKREVKKAYDDDDKDKM